MALIGLLALVGAAALQPPAPAIRASSTTLSVGATVVRPDLPPQVTVSAGRAVVSNANNVAVTAEGGAVHRNADGTLTVSPAGSGPVRIVFTY